MSVKLGLSLMLGFQFIYPVSQSSFLHLLSSPAKVEIANVALESWNSAAAWLAWLWEVTESLYFSLVAHL